MFYIISVVIVFVLIFGVYAIIDGSFLSKPFKLLCFGVGVGFVGSLLITFPDTLLNSNNDALNEFKVEINYIKNLLNSLFIVIASALIGTAFVCKATISHNKEKENLQAEIDYVKGYIDELLQLRSTMLNKMDDYSPSEVRMIISEHKSLVKDLKKLKNDFDRMKKYDGK
mgnify:CR=1 FL=1